MVRNFIISMLCLLPFSILGQTAPEYYSMAKRAKSSFDYRGAEKFITKALEASPGNSEYLAFRGDVYLGLEKYKRAREDFETAMALDSMDADPWIGRSRYFLYIGMPDSALHDAQVALFFAESSYGEAKANSALGEVFMVLGDDSLAITHLEMGLALDTTNARAYKKIATLEIQRQNYESAKAHLEKGLKYDKQDLEILINLAYTSNNIGDYRDALEYSGLALSLDQNHPLALSNRAYAYLHLEQPEAALKSIDESIKNDRRNPMAYRYKGEILIALGKNISEACRCFDRAEKYGYTEMYDDKVARLKKEYCP